MAKTDPNKLGVVTLTPKAVPREAIQYTGVNLEELYTWCGKNQVRRNRDGTTEVHTKHGWIAFYPDDYIIKESDSSGFYPCDPYVCHHNYEIGEYSGTDR